MDARAVPARTAGRILAPEPEQQFRNFVLYQFNCLDGKARRSCSRKRLPLRSPSVDVIIRVAEARRRQLLWLAQRVTNSREEAEDIVQEALLKGYIGTWPSFVASR